MVDACTCIWPLEEQNPTSGTSFVIVQTAEKRIQQEGEERSQMKPPEGVGPTHCLI